MLTTSLLVTAVACVVLALVPGVVTGFVALTLIGFGLLPALPIVLELTERRAGSSEGTAAGLMWLTGNLGGLVVAAVVGVLVDDPLPAFLLLAVLSLLTLPLLRSFSRVIRPRECRDRRRPIRSRSGSGARTSTSAPKPRNRPVRVVEVLDRHGRRHPAVVVRCRRGLLDRAVTSRVPPACARRSPAGRGEMRTVAVSECRRASKSSR